MVDYRGSKSSKFLWRKTQGCESRVHHHAGLASDNHVDLVNVTLLVLVSVGLPGFIATLMTADNHGSVTSLARLMAHSWFAAGKHVFSHVKRF